MSAQRPTAASTLGLLEDVPELSDVLSDEERQLVARVAIPVQGFAAQTLDLDGLLDGFRAFAAVIVDGLLLHRLAIGEQPTLRLLGAGDMLSRSGTARTTILTHSSYSAASRLRLAMLDDRVLLAARRFPRLFAALQARLGDQQQRLVAQLAICQLPRVEDRLLSLMWLLAETWGRVTPSATVLPMALTHDALGELVGARRPTVTLALKQLAARGSLFRQDGEWLLLQPPPQGDAPARPRAVPDVVRPQTTQWADPEPPAAPPLSEPVLGQLHDMIIALRDSHARSSADTRARLERVQRTRQRTQALRDQIARDRVTRRRAPARPPAP